MRVRGYSLTHTWKAYRFFVDTGNQNCRFLFSERNYSESLGKMGTGHTREKIPTPVSAALLVGLALPILKSKFHQTVAPPTSYPLVDLLIQYH